MSPLFFSRARRSNFIDILDWNEFEFWLGLFRHIDKIFGGKQTASPTISRGPHKRGWWIEQSPRP